MFESERDRERGKKGEREEKEGRGKESISRMTVSHLETPIGTSRELLLRIFAATTHGPGQQP